MSKLKEYTAKQLDYFKKHNVYPCPVCQQLNDITNKVCPSCHASLQEKPNENNS